MTGRTKQGGRPRLPDFARPQKGFRKVIINDHALYLPRGVSFNGPAGQWLFTYRREQRYFGSLAAAYRDLVDRMGPNPEGWRLRAGGPAKRLDTGVVGVWIGISRQGNGFYVFVRVTQSLSFGHRTALIGHIPAWGLTQQWLDERLREAGAVRRHYEKFRETGKLDRLLTLKDVPPASIPRRLVKRVSVDKVFTEVDWRV